MIVLEGKRRRALKDETHRVFSEDFAGRVLAFDTAAASFYGLIVASRRRSGRRIEYPDAQIAGIARAHGFAIATRNVEHFEDCGVTLINPWDA